MFSDNRAVKFDLSFMQDRSLSLFNDAFRSSDYIASNDRING
jgi:hypothetical protein